MKRILAVICLASCAAPASAPVAASAPPSPSPAKDVPSPACDDFYAYTAGPWLAEHPLPEGAPRWSPRLVGKAENRKRLAGLLAELAAKTDSPAGSNEKLAGDTFASCMGDAAGFAPLKPLETEIERVRTRADVNKAIRHLHDVGVTVGFNLSASLDYHGPMTMIANIAPGTLSLAPDEDKAKFLAKIGKVPEAAAIYTLEKRLVDASLDATSAVDPIKTDHRTTFAELEKLAPSLELRAYFDEAHMARGDVNVTEPRFLAELDKAFRDTPVATWKAYLSYRLHDAAAPFVSPPEPRDAFCAESTETLLPDPVGKLFSDRYFPPASKARTMEMLQKLFAAVKVEVGNASWMAPATKKVALAKLARYDIQAGYPNVWKDTSKLAVRRDAILANVLSERRFYVDEDRKRIGKTTDREVWLLPASSPGAYIDLQQIQLVIPAGFLLSTGYTADISDADLYGTMGVSIAHDMLHSVDKLGNDNDAMGKPEKWWTDADKKGWDEHVACVVATQEKLAPGTGKRVESEATGDLGGMRAAYQALEGKDAEKFFVAWGRGRAEVFSPATEASLLKSDPHPIARNRVLGTVANSAEFAKTFSCPVPPPCGAW